MKAYDIALFLFIFNVALVFVNYAYGDVLGQFITTEDYGYVESELESLGTTASGIDRFISNIPLVGDLYTSTKLVVTILWRTLTGSADLFAAMGMPDLYATALRAMFILVYGIGIADFLRGTSSVED